MGRMKNGTRALAAVTLSLLLFYMLYASCEPLTETEESVAPVTKVARKEMKARRQLILQNTPGEGKQQQHGIGFATASPFKAALRQRNIPAEHSGDTTVEINQKVNKYTSATPNSLNNWLVEQKRRISYVENLCKSLNYSAYNFRRANILVNDRDQVMLCYIPKVGCTTWKTILSTLGNGNKTLEIQDYIHSSKNVGYHFIRKDELDTKANYTKFMFVRDPKERLVSLYRSLSYIKLRRLGRNCTFERFINYVVHVPYLNEHYNSYQSLCEPCNYHYDFIGRYETFREDSQNILRHLFNKTMEEAIAFVPLLNSSNGTKSDLLTDRLWATIPDSLLEDFEAKYKADIEMFHYQRKTTDARD